MTTAATLNWSMLDGSVTYSLDRDDLIAARSAMVTRLGAFSRSFVPTGIVWLLLGIVNVALGFMPYHRQGFQFAAYVVGPIQILYGVLYLLMGAKSRFIVGRHLRIGRMSTVAWDRHGIVWKVEEGVSQTTAWKSVAAFQAAPTVIILYRTFGKAIVIPRHAFSDDGLAFLQYVDDKKIGKRLLIRASPGKPYRPQKTSDLFPW